MATAAFWDEPDTRRAVLTRLPAYRLTKFQDCLPERFALEVVENFLLDVPGTVRWLAADGAGWTLGRSRTRPGARDDAPGG